MRAKATTILFLAISFIGFTFISCGEDKKEQEIRTKITSTKWSGVYEESPLTLTFDGTHLIFQSSKDKATFELASVLHTHGTTLAGKESPFVYEYQISAEENLVIVDDEIELKISGDQIEWPMWHTDDKIIFKPSQK